MNEFYLRLQSPKPKNAPVTQVDLNPLVTALSSSTGVGGFVGLSVGYREEGQPGSAGELLDPEDISEFYHVELWAQSGESGALLFSGRINEINQDRGLGVTAFTAVGYGQADGAVNDSYFDSMDGHLLSALEILTEMTPTTTPILPLGTIMGLDMSARTAPSSLQGQTLGQYLDQINKSGVDSNQLVIYETYDGKINLRPRKPPEDGPEYIVSPERVKWSRSASKLYGAFSAEFQPKGGEKQRTVPAVDESFAQRYGFMRSRLIPNSEMDEAQAQLMAQRYLNAYRVPVVTGTITLTDLGPMPTAGGGWAPWWKVRYGDWAQIGYDESRRYMVTQTACDYSSRKNTVTVSNI